MEEKDTDLVKAALAGSERAFQQLVRRYERPVFSVIQRVVGDASRAEELAQDTFVKAFLRLETYVPERKFGNWLLAIAHHAAIDDVRRGMIRTAPLDTAPQRYLDAHRENETPQRIAERREVEGVLADAIGQLRPEYAEIITLRYEQDLSLEEIEEITHLPIGTIKSSLHRARIELAQYLRARGWRGTS